MTRNIEPSALLTVEDLCFDYKQNTPSKSLLLNHIDFQVKQGESLVIVGKSGCGKSTFLNILCGLVDQTESYPCYFGNIQRRTNNTGMLFQKNALFDSLTVLENLTFPLTEREIAEGSAAKQIASQYLEMVGLENSAELYPAELSGGMQKRLGIARTLIVRPELVFYDEPTAGLDPITSRQIMNLILQLQKDHRTTQVTVLSEIQRVQGFANKIFLLTKGSLIGGLPPDSFFSSTDPRISRFIQGLREVGEADDFVGGSDL